jgi:KDO2-lipid IV(A) lauroyltransferase
MLTRLALALIWLLHWLPLPMLAWLGNGFGLLLYAAARERRHVTLTNLGLCFPQLTAAEKSALARRHIMAFGRSFLELSIWWHCSPERLRRLVKLEGLENLDPYRDKTVILLAPHFVALDAGGMRLLLERQMVGMYVRQKNRVFEKAMLDGRLRFGNGVLASRQEGMKKVLKAMKEGYSFHYSPDMDYGPKDSIFVPFFGVQTATIPALSRLAKTTRATVIPFVTRMEGSGWNTHYVARLGLPWTDFPSGDDVADTVRLNAFIEAEVLQSPEQYYWLHKRFKTRPPGEKSVY